MANTLYEYYTGQGQTLPSLQERSKIYETAGLGASNTYAGTAAQNTALLKYLQTPQAPAQAPVASPTVPKPTTTTNPATVPSSLTTDQMMKPTPTVTTQTVPEVDPFVKALETSNKQIQDYITQAYQPVQQIQEQKQTLTDKLTSAIEKLGGKGQALVQQEEKLGVPTQVTQLQELNTQIAQKTGEFNKAIESLSAGTGLSTTIAGKQGQLRRQQAVEIGGLTSIAQAVQGNITLAQQTAQRTVDLEFAPVETEIQTLGVQIDNIYNDLSSAEKKAADQLKIQLDERTRLLNEQKDERNNVLNLGAQMAQNGAPNDVLTKVSQAKTVEEALQIGGTYLQEQPTVFEQKMQDLQLEEQRLRNLGLSQDLGLTTPTTPVSPSSTIEFVPNGGDINNFMSALIGQESGGNYTAENGRTGAFGAFQIMPANWPNWSVEAGLPKGAPQTQENQNAVASFKIQQYYDKYGNWEDVASMWYSGRPFSQVVNEGWADKKQGPNKTEPSVREYVNSVIGRMQNITPQNVQQEYSPTVIAYAQQYASDGKIPTGMPQGLFSQVAQAAKELPKPEGTVVDRNTGVASNSLSATQQDAISATYNLVNNTVPALIEAYNNARTGILPGAFSSIGVRTQAMQHFEDLRTVFLNQLLLANSGKVVSDKELQRYEGLLPSKFSSKGSIGLGALDLLFNQTAKLGGQKLTDIQSGLVNTLETTLKTTGTSIYGYSKVNVGGTQYTVGDIITNNNGQKGRVNQDGSITLL